MLDRFYKLVLNILVSLSEDERNTITNPYGIISKQVKKVDLSYGVIFKAFCSHLEPRESQLTETEKFIMSVKKTQIEVFQIDEDLIIKALRAMPEMKMTLSIEDVNILLKLLEKH